MKTLVGALIAFGFAQSVFATVAKPANTVDAAKGNAVVNQISFDYTVEDRAWYATGDDTGKLEAQKSFLITYNTTAKIATSDQSTSDQLNVDVSQKCEELGQLEYPGQIKNLPTGSTSALKTSITSSVVFKDASGFSARFVCLVDVTAQLPKK